jgi:radical SAM protein with 4Fe4S-binding SPASM domain
MTVTPDNVSRLADNVRSVFSEGFKRIVYLPVYEADWNPTALKEWGDQHSRLATWITGLAGAGRPGPDLPALKGIMSRLRGEPRRGCGAGATQVAVGTDGRIYPCYRSVYDPRGDRLVLGDVFNGFTRGEALAAMAALDADTVRPEGRTCDACPARDGCGFFCPALGHLMLQDLSAVPRSACLLTGIQVEVCRRLIGVQVSGRSVRRRRRWAAAAAAVAIIGGSVLGCGGRTTGGSRVDGAMGDGGTGDDANGPGLCPVLVDSGVDGAQRPDSTIGPGVCPVVIDGGVGEDEGIGPGVCPFVIDAGEDSGPFPGIC